LCVHCQASFRSARRQVACRRAFDWRALRAPCEDPAAHTVEWGPDLADCHARMPVAVLRLSGFLTEPTLNADEIHRIDGEPDREAARASPETLTLVSWNIAYGRQCEQHADVLASLEPDVCLLQEVDVGCRRSAFRNVARWLAHTFHMNWLFAGEFQEIGQGRPGAPALTGQAILSRYAISAPRVIRFSNQARWRWRASPLQPRRGARMALRALTAGLRVYNAHIESGRNDSLRRKQLAHLAAEDEAVAAPHEPVVLAGDFNCGPFGHLCMLDTLYDQGFVDALEGDPASRRTSVRRAHALDWILVRQLTVSSAGVAACHSGSDHFPVWTTVRRPTVDGTG
jgi:endonuclease/exonuclease/phosphatase family metal-dependent hydrolase